MTRLPNTAFHNNPALAHGKRPRTIGVVIHTIEGSDEGAEDWFKNPGAGGIGAHVIVGQELNHVVQTTDLDNICWHAPGSNRDRVGIEHEGSANYTKARWLLPSNRRLLRMSANRVAWICWHYELGTPKKGSPKNGVQGNVIGHGDSVGSDHTDPGKGWPWTFYIFLAKRAYKNLVRTGRWS